MGMKVFTYLRGLRKQEDGSLKRDTWLSGGQPGVYPESYDSEEELKKTLKSRWNRTHRIEEIEHGLRLYPIPPAGTGEHYQDVIYYDPASEE